MCMHSFTIAVVVSSFAVAPAVEVVAVPLPDVVAVEVVAAIVGQIGCGRHAVLAD